MLKILLETCLRCGGCVPLCPVEALVLLKSGITCDNDKCILCEDCVNFCPVKTLEVADE